VAPVSEPGAQPLQVEAMATPTAAPMRATTGEAKAEPEKPPAKPAESRPIAPAPAPAAKPVEPPAASAPAPQTATETAPVAPAPAPAEAPAIAKTFEGRKSVEFHVDPEETVIAVDGRVIGTADEWDGAGGGRAWVPPGPGDYTVRLSLDGFRTVWVRVRITPGAKREIAKVNTELDEIE
jgi:hypothetical protein